MREKMARVLAVITCLLIVAAAFGFAWLQNIMRAGSPPAEREEDVLPAPELDLALVEQGRQLYDESACALCHAIAGEGDLRSPLDGIGRRMEPARIRDFIAPPPHMREVLGPEAYEMKQGFHSLAPEQLDALVEYLRSLP